MSNYLNWDFLIAILQKLLQPLQMPAGYVS